MLRYANSVFLMILTCVPTTALAIDVEVSAGNHNRQAAAIEMPLPASLRDAKALSLTRSEDKKAIPVQILPGKPPTAIWILDKPLAKNNQRRYQLTAATKAMPASVQVTDDGEHLNVTVDKKKVFTYNHAIVQPNDPEHAVFARSGFIHPLLNPSGGTITDNLSPDHRHQHGIMFAWTRTTFKGRRIDFWNQKQKQGNVEHGSIEEVISGPVCGQFTVKLRHVILGNNENEPVLDEVWKIRIYNHQTYFLFDLISTQTCATDEPLQINKYHYGAMAIRGNRGWSKSGDFLTSEGQTRKEGNSTRVRWCDINGPIDGQQTGATTFGHPDNFRAPQPVRLHPKMPYYCFAPLILGDFQIEPGKPYVSKYRYYVHDGKLNVDEAERIWADYAKPPAAKQMR